MKYALNEAEIYIGGGIFGFKNSVMPFYKVQNISLKQNPYQSKRDLATLIIYSSAGVMQIPYITYGQAIILMDNLLYRVETSSKSWM